MIGSTVRKAISFFLKAAEYYIGTGHERPEASRAIESLRVKYIRTLVESVGYDAESPGKFDPDFLDRIERLLGFGSEEQQEESQ